MTAAPAARHPRPTPGEPRAYHFPRFERRQLENGVRLVIAPLTKLPIVTIAVIVDAGAVCDPAGKDGVAQLTAELILEGTEKVDGAALAERFELLGASVEAHANWDSASVTLTALTENVQAALELLGQVLRAPAFRVRDVERLKAERLSDLLRLRAEPRGLADELFSRFVYQRDSRYSRPDGGNEASVASLMPDDLSAFYRDRYRPGGMTVVVAGDLSADAAEKLIADALGSWTGAAPARVSTTDAPAHDRRAVHLVAKPDAAQSELRVGHVGLPRNNPDYFPVLVMNALLGGLFSSRINLNLREAHGYTYGAFSGFEWRRQSGPFSVSTAVRTDVTDAAIREILHEIDRMRAEPVTAEELSLATSYLDGVFPIRYESTAAIAAALTIMVIYGLPDDYYDSYRRHVRGITAEDVLRAAQMYLHPERLQVVVVGDAPAVRSSVEALAVGPVTVYDTQGQPAR